MSGRALIVTDVLGTEVRGTDPILPVILQLAERADFVIVSRNGTTTKVPTSLKKAASIIVTRGIDPERPNYSAFDGGTLRPVESLEVILARKEVTEVVVCGCTLNSVVAQTAFDANALGYVTTICIDACSGDVLVRSPKIERAGITIAESGDIWTDATTR
jgi:hypothetical protein